MLVDGDSHFYEHPSLWRDHISSADAHLALSVDTDELGYSHLTYAGRRLFFVVPIRLDDVEWAVRQVEQLGAGGCRFAMFVPGLVEGKPPSHPDNAVFWRSFTDSGVTPIWHITAGHRYALANLEAWESTGTGG